MIFLINQVPLYAWQRQAHYQCGVANLQQSRQNCAWFLRQSKRVLDRNVLLSLLGPGKQISPDMKIEIFHIWIAKEFSRLPVFAII